MNNTMNVSRDKSLHTERLDRDGVLAFLRRHDRYAVVCHAHPDGDALGSGVGLCHMLRSMGKQVRFVCPSPIPARYRFMVGDEPVTVAEDGNGQELWGQTVVTVDTASASLAGCFEELFLRCPPALSIDHHRFGTPFAERLLLDGTAAACAEIITDLALEVGSIDAAEALPLYAGINADTGGFRYSNTTSHTHELAARLLATGIDSAAVNTALYENRPLAEITAEKLALERMRLACGGVVGLVTFTEDTMRENGLCDEDIDNVVNLLRSVEGVSIAVHLKPRGPRTYKVSMRSKNGYTVSGVCAALGGGGHECAAGCTIEADTPAEAEQQLLAVLEAELGKKP